MSLVEFNIILNKYKTVVHELKSIQKLLQANDLEDLIDIGQIQDFCKLNKTQADGVCAILVKEKFLEPCNVECCVECGEIVEDEFCDECGSKDLLLVKKPFFRILKKLEIEKPWYEDFKSLPSDFFQQDQHREFIFGIPSFAYGLQKNPPQFLKEVRSGLKKSQEHDFRDHMANMISLAWVSEAEAQFIHGRTDLLVRAKNGNLDEVIGEFKVWARNDYDQVVIQLLGYFTEFQTCGFVFMINDNENSIYEKYRKLVEDTGHAIGPVIENPLVDSANWPHFMTRHKLSHGNDVTIFHFIFNTKFGFSL